LRSDPHFCAGRTLTFQKSANNQFLAWRVTVKEHLKEGQNELKISFANAMAKVCHLQSTKVAEFTMNEGPRAREKAWKAQRTLRSSVTPMRVSDGSRSSGTAILVVCMFARHSISESFDNSAPSGIR
jgi:hypothetical protein